MARKYHGVSQRQYKRDRLGRFAGAADYNSDPQFRRENRVRERSLRAKGVNPVNIHDRYGVKQRRGGFRPGAQLALAAAIPKGGKPSAASIANGAGPAARISAPPLSGTGLKTALIGGAAVAVVGTGVAVNRRRKRKRAA